MGLEGNLAWRSLVAVAIAMLATAAGCGGGDGSVSGGGGSTAGTGSTVRSGTDLAAGHGRPATKAAAPACRRAEVSKGKKVSYAAPRQTVKGKRLTAVVRTSCGRFSIALDAKRFPATVASFVFLARQGFYDGMPFDKAGGGRYLHGGDPPGGATGPGYTVEEEVPSRFIYRHGVVAMAQPGEAGYEKAGSQFFIVLARPWLDFSSTYPPLGTVKGGLGVLERISMLGPHSEEQANVGVLGPVGKLRRAVTIEGISIRKG